MLKLLRLLVVGVSWPPETFLDRLLRGLAASGMEVTVASPRPLPRLSGGEARVRWIWAPPWNVSPLRRVASIVALAGGAMCRALGALGQRPRFGAFPPRWMWSPRALHRLLPLVGRRADVVYFPWNSAAIAYEQVFDWGVPVVVSCRGSQIHVAPRNPARHEIRAGLAATFARAAAVHCVSECIKREAIGFGLDPAKARVIRPAVDPTYFVPGAMGAGSGELRVVSTGSVIWRKGYEYALVALRRLLDAGVPASLAILGDGAERQRLLFTVDDLGLHGRVELLGRRPPAQVRERLQQADVFLLPSVAEGISNAALEAMACGLPVVSTCCGGMDEAIRDGVEGLLVPVRDPEAMAAALHRLWVDPALRRRLGGAARARVEGEFSSSRALAQWQELFSLVAAA